MTQTTASTPTSATLRPAVDVYEDSAGITLYADLPGVAREQLTLEVEGDTLTIEAEARRGRYRRVFTLGKELDPAQVSAELQHGVLRLRIAKAAHAQPRRVDVQVH